MVVDRVPGTKVPKNQLMKFDFGPTSWSKTTLKTSVDPRELGKLLLSFQIPVKNNFFLLNGLLDSHEDFLLKSIISVLIFKRPWCDFQANFSDGSITSDFWQH